MLAPGGADHGRRRLSAAISTELKRLNTIVRAKTGNDLILLGVEKTGAFVTHFDEIEQILRGVLQQAWQAL